LLKLREVSGGRLLFARSLAERLLERGIRFAAVSSGSTLLKLPSGNPADTTYTASSGALTSVSCVLRKN
jgi:NAD(P)-dependent dehydrogenase (short-subunit alcohol dehydrogenase family)